MKSFFSTVLLCLLSLCAMAQQQSSKSKSSDKLYEKGNLKNHVMMYNATGVNTANLDFSPVFYQNGIVYVSSRYKNGPVDKKIGETFFELFYAEFNASGMPQSPRNFSLQINSQVHEGPVSFSRNGDLLYFTRNNLKNGISKANEKGQVVLKIYEAHHGKYDWENVTELPFNSDEYTCVHPSLSADGQRLFFASDMPGGYGGMDLYFVERRPDGWSKPINMGKDVNTPSNEVFPYIHDSGTLFFSSNGHGGEGGLDIFMIDISTNTWGTLKNIGIPFNSPTDDLGFILSEEGTHGFLASDRAGGYGKDDIYSFEAENPIIDGEPVMLSAMVVAYDGQTNERLPGADIRLFQRSADGFIEGDDLYDVQLLPSDDGDLVMKLVRKNPEDMSEAPLRTNINGESICEMRPEKNYLLLVTKEGYENTELLYSTIGETEPQTIRIAMKSRSCTTVAGTVSVQDYQTLVPNALVRILNETTGTEELIRSNASGEFNYCLPLGHEYAVIAEKEGYTKGMSKVSTVGTNSAQILNVNIHVQPIAENILKEPIKEGSVIVLENIYYDFDQYFIRKGAARDLDALAELMKLYPTMEIELSAHTDSRGDDMYNLELSLKRAESAKRYLIQKGIAGDRVREFGMGESEIRNQCVDGVECTDEEHAYNRRTEVKITHMDEPIRVEYKEGSPIDDGKGE